MSIKVKAKAEGYYASAIKKPGQIFSIAKAEDFGSSWMIPADAAAEKALAKEIGERSGKFKKLKDALVKDAGAKPMSEVEKTKLALKLEKEEKAAKEKADKAAKAKKEGEDGANDLV